ncbi:hypothetical protein IWQ60_005742 [Tieghemiomyces parasiticus]|uniref:Peptidase C14 caspase domain-containing protein n=1 Tax=Tieghemiomyces parasiticus TaxID=78921 RepID=A0A9W8A993_9FUNG|nr:hypothetical protein IWQ60_005742 [Tieghemiomyces parasiticus]
MFSRLTDFIEDKAKEFANNNDDRGSSSQQPDGGYGNYPGSQGGYGNQDGSSQYPGSQGGYGNYPGSQGGVNQYPGPQGGYGNYPGSQGGSNQYPGQQGGSQNFPPSPYQQGGGNQYPSNQGGDNYYPGNQGGPHNQGHTDYPSSNPYGQSGGHQYPGSQHPSNHNDDGGHYQRPPQAGNFPQGGPSMHGYQPYSEQAYMNAPPPQGPGPQGMHIAPPGSEFFASSPHPGGSNGGAYVQDVGGYQTQLSNCRGRKKAIFIGINYFDTDAALKGCINDVKNISEFLLSRKGFNRADCVFLTDDQSEQKFLPTYANIQAGCAWLVKDARPGDSLFLHYSGHGGTQKDTNNDEADGFDETILPLDYKERGQITDDLLNDWLVKPLPGGARLTCVFDSCHSGTVLDLPYVYNCDGTIEVKTTDNRKEAAMALLNAGLSFQRGDSMGAINTLVQGIKVFAQGNQGSEADRITKETKGSTADVVMFSGCRDDQTSADANINNQATGAMSHALIEVLSNVDTITYTRLLFAVRDILKSNYKQIPQMSTGRPMDMNTDFII